MTEIYENEDVMDQEIEEDIDEMVKDSKVPAIPKKSEDEVKTEELKKGPVKRFFGWCKEKTKKARRNPVIVGIASFAAGVGVTLGATALVNHFSKDEDDAEMIETDFADPMELDEPETEDDFVPEVDVTVEEPEVVTEEV